MALSCHTKVGNIITHLQSGKVTGNFFYSVWFSTCKIHDVENPRRKIRNFRRVENHVNHVTYVTDPTLPEITKLTSQACGGGYTVSKVSLG